MKLLLFILVTFIAVTSTLSGSLMITDPSGNMLNLPLNLLEGTPFKNFLVPGILLFGVVGTINLIAVFYHLQRHPARYNWAMAGGAVITGWIIIQMILISTVHWLHFLYLGIGIMVFFIAYQLKGKWAV